MLLAVSCGVPLDIAPQLTVSPDRNTASFADMAAHQEPFVAGRTRKVIDLTRALDQRLPLYVDGAYSDPPFRVSEWCAVQDQGYRVSRIECGTQTGTHIDAPSHFSPGAADLEQLPIECAIGSYFLLELARRSQLDEVARCTARYAGETVLFLRAPDATDAVITAEALQHLMRLPPRLWVLAGEVTVEACAPLEFHRRVAGGGKYLAEGLEPSAAMSVPARGEIFVLPLALTGVSGAPCRIILIAE